MCPSATFMRVIPFLKECIIGAPAGRFGLALLVLIIRTRVKGAIGPAFTLKRRKPLMLGHHLAGLHYRSSFLKVVKTLQVLNFSVSSQRCLFLFFLSSYFTT